VEAYYLLCEIEKHWLCRALYVGPLKGFAVIGAAPKSGNSFSDNVDATKIKPVVHDIKHEIIMLIYL